MNVRNSLIFLMVIFFIPHRTLTREPLKNFWDNTSSWVKYSVAVVGGYLLWDLPKRNGTQLDTTKNENNETKINIKSIDWKSYDFEKSVRSSYSFNENRENNFDFLNDYFFKSEDSDYCWPFFLTEQNQVKNKKANSEYLKSHSYTQKTLVNLILDLILKKKQKKVDAYSDFLTKLLFQIHDTEETKNFNFVM